VALEARLQNVRSAGNVKTNALSKPYKGYVKNIVDIFEK
jgi:hypothetical protein